MRELFSLPRTIPRTIPHTKIKNTIRASFLVQFEARTGRVAYGGPKVDSLTFDRPTTRSTRPAASPWPVSRTAREARSALPGIVPPLYGKPRCQPYRGTPLALALDQSQAWHDQHGLERASVSRTKTVRVHSDLGRGQDRSQMPEIAKPPRETLGACQIAGEMRTFSS